MDHRLVFVTGGRPGGVPAGRVAQVTAAPPAFVIFAVTRPLPLVMLVGRARLAVPRTGLVGVMAP